jgi:hypothetical protein
MTTLPFSCDIDTLTRLPLRCLLAGEVAVQPKSHQTPVGESDSFIVTQSSVENQGTTLAQVAVAGAGNHNWIPHLDEIPVPDQSYYR